MKKLILIALLFASTKLLAQDIPVDSVTHKVTYQEVVKVDNTPQAELYNRAKSWFAKSFRSANKVLQMYDKDLGKLIGKGSEPLTYKYALVNMNYTLHYTLAVVVKDGRYRYEITDITVPDDDPAGYHLTLDQIVVDGNSGKEKTKKDNGEYRNRFKGYIVNSDLFFKALITDLKTSMAAKSKDNF